MKEIILLLFTRNNHGLNYLEKVIRPTLLNPKFNGWPLVAHGTLIANSPSNAKAMAITQTPTLVFSFVDKTQSVGSQLIPVSRLVGGEISSRNIIDTLLSLSDFKSTGSGGYSNSFGLSIGNGNEFKLGIGVDPLKDGWFKDELNYLYNLINKVPKVAWLGVALYSGKKTLDAPTTFSQIGYGGLAAYAFHQFTKS